MIIQSLLDTDLYKFTMQQVVWSRFPHAHADYAFRCRSKDVDLRPFADEIRTEIDALATLQITDDEAVFLQGIRFFKPAYVDALRQLRLDPSLVKITTNDELRLTIHGPWYQTILFEVPILAIINEVYFRNTQPNAEQQPEGMRRLEEKCRLANAVTVPLRLIEFGTRRRYSAVWQETVVRVLRERLGDIFLGTSNVHWARKYHRKPFGTMAHEFLQAGQAFTAAADSQKFALEQWMQEYRGDLGIALSDVVGMEAFLRDFDLLFSKAFDGARHDSGDPFAWGEKLIAHYEAKGIDPATKTAVFSDGLDIPRCIALAERFHGRIRTQFGVGTNLTNDHGFPALQIVLKMTHCNGRPVAKISDTPGKLMSEDAVYLAYLRQAFGLPPV